MVALAAALSLVSVPAVTSAAAAAADQPATAVPAAPVAHALATAPADGSDTPVETTEIDLSGVDPDAESELVGIEASSTESVPAAADPETEPGLEVENPLGALPDEVAPDIITEKMSAEPFSVMGITWDLDSSLADVVVQYRTYQEGAWTDWGWVGATEEYAETADGSQASRGATDPIFVPDSTGVQLVVSSSSGAPTGVKVVLIDPGAGPDGTGASQSSGEPTDTETAAPAPTPSPTPTADQDPVTPGPAPSVDPNTPAESPTPSESATPPTAEPAEPSLSEDPTDVPTGTETPTPTETESGTTPDAGEAGGGSGGTASTLALPAAAIAMPAMVSRAQWGASAPVCQVDYGQELRAAAIHHTASTNNYTQAQVPGLLRGFAEYHMRPEAAGGRGWCDLGYNFLVDKFGTIYEGRGGGTDLPVVGVHTGGFNSRIVGVAAIGNYEEAVPSAALNESLSRIIAWKLAQHRVTANSSVTLVSGGGASKYPAGTPVTLNTIFGHRDAQYTSCPGRYLYAAFGDIRNRVAALANPVIAESPVGGWDRAVGGGSSIRVAGWARDPSSPNAPVSVRVIVDGSTRATISAANPRSDVGPHGFDATVGVSAGRHVVCLRYVNIGGGGDVSASCRTVTATQSNPVGVFEAADATSSTITVKGWARDPDSRSPISVHVAVDGKVVRSLRADQARPDVEQSAPGQAGPAHGFTGTVDVGQGKHTVCLYGINVGAGSNALIGCREVVVTNPAPIGRVDSARATAPDQITVSGWALDPDTTASIDVHVYVDGAYVARARADGARADVGRAYGLGDAHGYELTLPATAGTHRVCVFGINVPKGSNPSIGCASVTVVNATPIGRVDSVTGGKGELRVQGWALDPDTSDSITVHVAVDGRVVRGLVASGVRPDVGRAYRLRDQHGFDVVVPAARGERTVCVFAINVGGPNPRIACRQVTVT